MANFTRELFWEPDELYARHRIPGLVITSAGTVIVWNEARTEGSDWSLMDIYMQRSTDGGKTFGPRIYLAEGTLRHKTVNNGVMMQGADGTLHFLFCRNYAIRGEGVFHRYSTDDGVTWSHDEEITYATKPEIRNAFAMGPGHGVCFADGTLAVTCWMVLKTKPDEEARPEDEHFPSTIGVLYSRDNGKTWQIEGPMSEYKDLLSPGECEMAQLPDGSVYMTIRQASFECRGRAYSRDGIHFDVPEADPNIQDPCNFGAVATYPLPDGNCVLLLVNSDHRGDDERVNMTLRGSLDGGKTWAYKRAFDVDGGGYPDIAVGKDGVIYILYEHAYGEKMWLIRTDLDWLKGESV